MARTQRRSRLRQRLARLCAAFAVVCLALAGIGFGSAGAQEEQSALVPDVFRASAASEVLSAFLDRDAFLPVNQAFRFIALDGTGSYESSNQTARASIFYPGNGIVSGPTLACSTFGSQFPEQFAPILDACARYQYPLTVFADSLNPDGSTTGSAQLGSPSDPVSAEAVRAVAHAGLDASTSDAAMTALRVLGLPPMEVPLPVPGAPELDTTVVTIDSATSTTNQTIDEAGVLVVEAESVLDGVRLVGGLVEIGSIRSVSTVTDDGHGGKTREADLDVSGVTVGGMPAEITDDGLVIGEPTGADGPLVQQLTSAVNQLVRALGLEIHTLAVEDGEEDGGVAFARSGGVLVEFAADAQGLPILPGPQGDIDPNGVYTGLIQLGHTGATGLAAVIDDIDFSAPGPSDFQAPGLPAIDAPSAPVDPSLADVAGGAADDDGERSTEIGSGERVVSVSEVLASGRVRLAYLAFTLIALAACISPKFALPARLPGRNP